MTHPNFYQDTLGGQSVWRCCVCEHDTFSFKRAMGHSAYNDECSPIVLPETDMGIETWKRAHSTLGLLRGKRIVIGLLTWNTDEASLLCADSVVKELEFLSSLGAECDYYWVDNGSTDDTQKLVAASLSRRLGQSVELDSNRGQSFARNLMIDHALRVNANYLLFVDGDIQLVPFSSYAMAQWLRLNDGYGCIGLYSRNCTDDLGEAEECRSLTGLTTDAPHMAWTQYGMFDCKMFAAGVRFDENAPFRGPGWGFEDDDLGLQMLNSGYKSANSRYFRYLHQNLHSGLNQLPPTLAAKVWMDRKSYVYEKWKRNPICASYVANMRNQTMPR